MNQQKDRPNFIITRNSNNSGFISTTRLTEDLIEEGIELIKNFCNIEGYCYVNNHNITRDNLFKDGLHLLHSGKPIS